MINEETGAALDAPAFPQERTCPYEPPPGYAELRERGPLSKITLFDGRTAWVVTGHAEARSLLVDSRISADTQNPDFPFLSQARAATTRQRTIVTMDPPEHDVHRRMLIPSFTLRKINALRPTIERVVDELLDGITARRPPLDLVSEFAVPVPSMVICALLGVPYDDHEFFERQTRRIAISANDRTDAMAALGELFGYLDGLVKSKEEDPGDGLLDELIESQLRPGNLTREEIILTSIVLLLAGHENTANMIALGTVTLLRHPAELDALRADPELISGAVDELLRYTAVADTMSRVATADIEIAGHVIRAGDGVILPNAAINRDAAAFADPDRFDVRRSPVRHHNTFGYGVHQCLGQHLARLELEIVFSRLFERLPTLRLAVPVEELEIKPAGGAQGVFELPVTW
ncbi:cytochrome P450 [Actinomadura spongiicola]|uniref:Cytochrome P450 n=1 Tax=Actinomadura spongiicola TaxID=2303421 RepID=A0A372G6N4_9ACTN|nr:cytochrome P450 [Actinomadura spongiicola]RFS81058.1 cytochrome P450 [Actinomadura spongiicola]